MLLALVLTLAGCGGEQGYAEDGYGEGGMGETMHTYFFDYTVNRAYLCDTFEGYGPSQEGYVLLAADVTVKNTHTESIVMYDTDFRIQWGAEDIYDAPITYYTNSASDEQLPMEYELAAGETRTGLLVFEVPDDQKDFSISYLELFENGTEEGEEGDLFSVFFTVESGR